MKIAGGLLVWVDDGNLIVKGRSDMLRGSRDVIDRALEDGVAGAHVMTQQGVSECAVEVMDPDPEIRARYDDTVANG